MTQHEIQVAEQCAAAGKHDSLVDDVGSQFRLSMLKRDLHRLHDGPDRLSNALGDLPFGDDQFLRNSIHQVAASDRYDAAVAFLGRAGGADLLDALGATLANEQTVVAAKI